MGLFDSIRRVVSGDDESAEPDDATTQPALVDTHALDVAALRERATGVAGEVEVLDFSLDSLSRFDDAIDAGYDEDLVISDEPRTYATDTVRFGCYLGEVLVRTYDGEWTQNPDWGATISGPDGTTTVAVFDVAERSITTCAVFEAAADRAAVEVGLAGVSVDRDSELPPEDSGDSASASSLDNTDEAATPVPSDGDSTGEALGAEEPMVETATDDAPSTKISAEDEPPTEQDTSEAATDTADPPADTTLTAADSETDGRVDEDTESLIEEAEPEAAGGDLTAGESEPAAESTPFDDGMDEAAPSLFDDGSAGAGPTVADAPSADDGPLAPVSDSDSAGDADREDAQSTRTDSPNPGVEPTHSDGPADEPDPPTEDPTDGDDLRATYAETAEELVSFWTEYDLDYTPESLQRLDGLVSEEWDDDRFDEADFGSDDGFDNQVFTSVSTELGSYFGEVLVRELDAEWSQKAATDGVVVEGANGPLAIPVFKVAGTSLQSQPVFARSYDSLLSDLESDV